MHQQLIKSLARSCARAFSFVFVLFLAGCISLPPIETFPAGTSGTAVETNRFLGITVLRSASFLSGDALPIDATYRAVSCEQGHVAVTVNVLEQLDVSVIEPTRICRDILHAIDYVDDFVTAKPKLSRHYEIFVVPFGARLSKRNISWWPGGRLKPLFLRYAYSADPRKTRIGTIDTVAHETLHIWSSVLEANQSPLEDERIAYRVGACAQLAVEGEIRREDLPLLSSTDGTKQMRVSEAAATAWAAELETMLSDGIVVADSAQGRLLLADCREQTTDYLSHRLSKD